MSIRAGRRLPFFAAAALALIAALATTLALSRRTHEPPSQRRGTPVAHSAAPLPEERGVEHAAELLPLARRLAIESLRDLADSRGVGRESLARAEERVSAVGSVRLDDGLGDLAEWYDEEPTVIRIGPGYARALGDDDESILLLGHELTHAAAFDGELDALIDGVAGEAARRASVSPSEDQREDLVCDLVGAEALKRFARMRPDGEPAARRVARIFGAHDGDAGDATDGDEEHLSSSETWRAIVSLDPELSMRDSAR
jgi:hypothetical protein